MFEKGKPFLVETLLKKLFIIFLREWSWRISFFWIYRCFWQHHTQAGSQRVCPRLWEVSFLYFFFILYFIIQCNWGGWANRIRISKKDNVFWLSLKLAPPPASNPSTIMTIFLSSLCLCLSSLCVAGTGFAFTATNTLSYFLNLVSSMIQIIRMYSTLQYAIVELFRYGRKLVHPILLVWKAT